jgi:hypothetical protein
MIVLGILLIVLGWALAISVLYIIGLALLIVGVVFELFGAFGRPVLGRRHYW